MLEIGVDVRVHSLEVDAKPWISIDCFLPTKRPWFQAGNLAQVRSQSLHRSCFTVFHPLKRHVQSFYHHFNIFHIRFEYVPFLFLFIIHYQH